VLPAITPTLDSPAPPPDPAAVPADRAAAPRHATRLTILLFGFCLWALIIVLRLGQFMIVDRDRYLEAMSREALFTGVVPAGRGRILDRDGRPLAWSERVFNVHWHLPRDRDQAEMLRDRLDREPWLTDALPRPLPADRLGQRLQLARDLPAAQAVRLEALSDLVPGLEVTAAFRRHVVDDPTLRPLLGAVASAPDGTEVGISGLERAHDDVLRGLPGSFRVMLDREGRWLPETWRKVGELRPGYDVQLPLRGSRSAEASP